MPSQSALQLRLVGELPARDIVEMHAQADRLIAFSTQFGLPLFAIIGHFFVGLALHHKGQVAAGIGRMEEALAAFEQANFKLAVQRLGISCRTVAESQ
jgi:hypothetical protein